MPYLLPSQILLDLIAAGPNRALSWVNSDRLSTSEMRVSVISVAEAKGAIAQLTNGTMRAQTDMNLQDLLAKIRKRSDQRPIEFGERHSEIWQSFAYEGSLQDVPQSSRMVYATAVRDGLVVAEESHPMMPALERLGVNFLVL